jgi:uncharacterized protein YraI
MGDLTVMQKQEIARGAQAMGAMVGRQARKKAEKLTSPLTTLSFWGRILSVFAFMGMLGFAGMMILDASRIAVDRGRIAVVTGDTVNVRQDPSTGSAVVTQAHSGARFEVTGSEGRWTKVRSADGGNAGWIATGLIETKMGKTMVFTYEMKGYFTALLICFAVVFFALRMKKVEAPATRANPNETLLVNKK